MRRLFTLLSLLALCLSLTARAEVAAPFPYADEAAAVAAGARKLTTEELHSLYLGNVVVGRHADGSGFRTPVAVNGGIGATDHHGPGRAEVMGDGKVCMQFEGLWEGKQRCWTHYLIDGRYLDFNADGSPGAELHFESP